MPEPKGTVKRVQHEASDPAGTTEISAKQGKGDIRNQIISGTEGPGTSAKESQPYLHQAANEAKNRKEKEGLASQLNQEPGAAAAVDSFFKPGRNSGGMAPNKTAEVAGVLQQEAIRSDFAVAQVAALVGTAKAQGEKANWKELFKAFPMQREGARRKHESLGRHLDRPSDKEPSGKRVRELRDDIVQQIKTWIDTLGLIFDNIQDAYAKLRKLVREFWAVHEKGKK